MTLSLFTQPKKVIKHFVLFLSLFTLIISSIKAQTPTEILTNADIIKMKESNLSSIIIKSKIKTTVCKFSTDTQSLIELSKAGISDDVIELMVNKSSSSTASTNSTIQQVKGSLSYDKKAYVTANGITLNVGQTFSLGTPSDKTNGLFEYCNPLMFGQADNSKYMKGEFSNKQFIIDKFTIDAHEVTFLVFKVNSIQRYRIAIEAAISSGELNVK